MSTSAGAWEVYRDQLFPHRHGYPLWMPDPDPTACEVQLGDVGWISKGGFRQLFNARKKAEEQTLKFGVPSSFIPFDPPNLSISGPHPTVGRPPLFSRTITRTNAAAGASVGMAPAAGGGSFTFQCNADSGAFVSFSPDAWTCAIDSKRHVVNYVREHSDSWKEISEKWGLDLKEEDMYFVSGTTKTERWAVAAFKGQYRRKQGTITADLGSLASLDLSVSISDEVTPGTQSRVGPQRNVTSLSPAKAITAAEGQGHPASLPPYAKADQCIFFNYYKMKRRFGFRYLKAAAGPDQLPSADAEPEEDAVVVDDGMEYDSGGEGDSTSVKSRDPVDHLLDYILKSSEATIAIASDRELYALFEENQDFPDDVAGAIEQLQPSIDIDEHGVGTVSVTFVKPVDPPPVREEEFAQPLPGDNADSRTGNHGDGSGSSEVLHDKRAEPGQTSVHDGSVTALVYSPNGRYAASGSEDTSIIVWDVPSNSARYKHLAHQDTVSSLAFSRDNEVLASGSNDGEIILWKVSTGDIIRRLPMGVPIHSVAFSPDGTKFIAGAYEGSLYVWNTATWEDPHIVEKHLAVVTFVVFSPDGRLMATGGTESDCFVWELATLEQGEPKSTLHGHKGMVCAAAFSPDGRRIITASDDGSSRIWNAETGEALVILHEHSGPVWTVAFSPDGKRVASGSSDSSVKVCDSFSGDRLLSLDGHDSMINAVEFSPDGKYVASAASDNTVRLWDAEDGTCYTTFNEHSDNVTMVLFSPDNVTLASGSHDGTVWIRPVVVVSQS